MQAKYRLAMALMLTMAGVAFFAAAVLMTPIVFVPGVGFPLFSAYFLVLGGAALSFTFALIGGFKAISDLINNRNEGTFLPQSRAEEISQETITAGYEPLVQYSHENQITESDDKKARLFAQVRDKTCQKSIPQKSQGFFRSLCCFFDSSQRGKNIIQNEDIPTHKF